MLFVSTLAEIHYGNACVVMIVWLFL